MPVTVRGGDILFNDGSTQATAAGTVNTTAVLNATAGAALGAVGTYAWMRVLDATTTVPGGTKAATNMRYGTTFTTPVPAGTWRAMGGVDSYVNNQGVWLRIS